MKLGSGERVLGLELGLPLDVGIGVEVEPPAAEQIVLAAAWDPVLGLRQ